MSVLNAEMFDEVRPRTSWAHWLARWHVLTCLFITAMFMLATNDPDATSKWQEVTREKSNQLSLVLESGRATRQIAFIALGLWGAAGLLRPARRYRAVPLILFPSIVFVGWAFISVLWSTDRAFTVKRLVVFACLLAGVLGFVRRFRPRDLAFLALVGCTIQCLANIVADLLWATGDYGKSGYRLSGLQHPNHAGISAMFLLFACVYYFDRTRLTRFLCLGAAAFVLLVITKSRSSLFAGLGGLSLYALIRWPGRKMFAAILLTAVALCTFAVLDASGAIPDDWSNIIHMGREDSQSAALTGRPMVWTAALELFGDDPTRYLYGFGFDSFWTPEHAIYVSNRVWYHISEGHNAYFDLLLALGGVGLVCYAMILFASLIRWSQLSFRHRNASYAFCAAVLMFAVIHGLTESTLVAPNFSTFFSLATMGFLAIRAPDAWPTRDGSRQ